MVIALRCRQKFLTNFADDDRGNIHSLKLLITFRDPRQAGFLVQIVSGDLFIERDGSHGRYPPYWRRSAVEFVLDRLGSGEGQFLARTDLDRLAGCRVAAVARG